MFFLMVAAALVATLGYAASVFRNHGRVWADEVCTIADVLCSSSRWFAVAALILFLVYLFQLSRPEH
jgi:uncharacterized membrane protein